MANLYGSYDAFVAQGAPDLYGSYDAMPGAPGGGGSYDVNPYAQNYNSYDSYIGAPAGYGAGYGSAGYADPYAQQSQPYGRAPNPQLDLHDIRGVGITFDQKPSVTGSSPVFVKSIARSSSADRTGLVRRGDVLLRVNGVDVIGRPISALRPIIPGPAGTTVCLSFRRYDGRVYDVNLRRTTPRLGTKNSRYYSGIRYGGPQQQQPAQPQYQPAQPQYLAGYGAAPASYLASQYAPQYAPQYAQQPFSGYTLASPGYAGTVLGGGSSYVISHPGIGSQPISYLAQPQQIISTQQPIYTNSVQYTTQAVDAHADEIKGTQV